MYGTKEMWQEKKYIKKYGEEQFFKDLETYEEIIGKTWEEIVDEEQPISLVAIHEKALEAIKLRQSI